VRALAGSTYAFQQIGNSGEARKRLNLAFARLGELKLYPADRVEPASEPDKALRALAAHEAATGNIAKAIEVYEDLLKKLMASEAKPQSRLSDAFSFSELYKDMSAVNRRSNETKKAADLDARRSELWRHWDRKLPGNSFVQRQLEN
jgi:hypothetical protein